MDFRKPTLRSTMIFNTLGVVALIMTYVLRAWWFLEEGDPRTDSVISVHQVMTPLVGFGSILLLANVALIRTSFASSPNRGHLFTLSAMVIGSVLIYLLAVAGEEPVRQAVVSELSGRPMTFCKTYRKGGTESGTTLHYYAETEQLCDAIIEAAPERRRDFGRAAEALRRLNAAR
ncbi:MAG: hypothetical protein AAF645_28255 [Myxococcota bacterium]